MLSGPFNAPYAVSQLGLVSGNLLYIFMGIAGKSFIPTGQRKWNADPALPASLQLGSAR